MIPTYAIVPVLIASFVILAFDHYQLNPLRPMANARFALMVSAVVMMFVQISLAGLSPWISLVIFALAWIWLAAACLLVWRRLSAS